MNRKKRLSWCREKLSWSVENNWKKIIFSDESKIIIGQYERVHMEKYGGRLAARSCLTKTAPKFQVVIFGSIYWFGLGTVAFVDKNINANKYTDILKDNLWPVVA